MVSTREIAGKRIIDLTYTPVRRSDGRPNHLDVTMHLDDGSYLYFIAEETEEGDEYGVFIGRGGHHRGQGRRV